MAVFITEIVVFAMEIVPSISPKYATNHVGLVHSTKIVSFAVETVPTAAEIVIISMYALQW